MAGQFEWFVAHRYLRARGSWAGWIWMLAGGLLCVAAGVMFYLGWRARPLTPMDVAEGIRNWKQFWQLLGIIFLSAGVLAGVFGYFLHTQSIFTTISTYGVFLGTTALIIVLSVMNGFEVDLRQKILGSNAHIQITRDHGAFTEWRAVRDKVLGVCRGDTCVKAATAYVTSEVVIAANSNYGGAIIKGIDPKTAPGVTDLRKNLTDKDSLVRLWPVLPDGGVGEYENKPEPDAGPPGGDDDEEPIDFSGGGDVEEEEQEDEAEEPEPIDFSGEGKPDGGLHVAPLDPILIDPFDPDRPRKRARLDPRVASLDGVLVGKELAKNLHLYVGQEVQIVSPLGQDTPAGQVPRSRPFRIAGTFYSGMYEYDTKFVYVTVPALQSFLSLGDEVTGIEVKVSDINDTGPVVAALRDKLGPEYRVADWKEINRNLFSALKLEKIAMFSVLANIIVVACLSIILNLIMVVVEKGKEIAILKSMGATDWAVMRVFVFEGLHIGGIGTLFGMTVGIGTCLALEIWGLPLDPNVYYIDRLPVAMDPLALAAVALAGVGISVLSTLYPSWIASRLRPVEGLRYQ